jgi:membrane-bound inhibitor of C-type lysozyme
MPSPRRVRIACLAGVVVTIAAAGPALADATASYTCGDGTALTATFTSDPAAAKLVIAGGKTMTLPQVVSADGGRYADDTTEFWIRGNSARFTISGKETECETKD